MKIPSEVKSVIEKLKKAGFEAYIVGGCVRDTLRGVKPLDWDITTSAKPEEIEKIFKKTFIENKFGTVTVLTDSKDEALKEIEITPFRIEEQYTDKRHPEKIKWAKTIEEDLGRRDFTVNAMAMEIQNAKIKNQNEKSKFKIIDLFGGQKDLEKKVLRAVGSPEDRFSEDALRLMRAARLATILDFSASQPTADQPQVGGGPAEGWKIEKNTAEAIKKCSHFLEMISKERVRDEFLKIMMSERADEGIELLRELKLLRFIIPELEEGYKMAQNKHHIYEVYEHAILSLKYAAKKNYNIGVRLAALFHDIGKPRVKEGEGPEATFYNHEVVGARMTKKILQRLRFSKKDVEKITKLVRYHLFYYTPEEVSESSVRRLLRKVGPEDIDDLLKVRYCDRIGSGCPKAEPYKLRHLRYAIEKVSQDPISVKMLKVSGNDVMKILSVGQGPKVGHVLSVLLGYVLEDPKKNKKEFLQKEIEKLGKLSDEKLKDLVKKAEKERDKLIMKQDKMTKKKYWVT